MLSNPGKTLICGYHRYGVTEPKKVLHMHELFCTEWNWCTAENKMRGMRSITSNFFNAASNYQSKGLMLKTKEVFQQDRYHKHTLNLEAEINFCVSLFTK